MGIMSVGSSQDLFSNKSSHKDFHNISDNNLSHRSAMMSRFFSAMDSALDLQRSGRRDTYKINIGNKKVTFQLNEKIFQLEQPSTYDYIQDTQCIVCDTKMGRSEINHCQFCGHKACKKCAYKMRMFANQASLIKRQQLNNMDLNTMQKVCKMGKVCRICDRKFFIRTSYEQHASEIKFYNEQT